MTTARDMPPANARRKPLSTWLEPLALLLPGGAWLLLLLVLPIGMILIRSLVPVGGVGLSLDNYARVFLFEGKNFVYLSAIARSLLFSLITTFCCLVVGFPVAYWLAIQAPKPWRSLLLLAFVLPLWTSSLLRAYAWITILRPTGVLNAVLNALNLPSLYWLDRPQGALLGMVYTYLPYMVLVLYSSLEKLDLRLLEAAADLGATDVQAFWRVTIPQAMPGIVAGGALVSITSFGDYINPALLGGPSGSTISMLIELQFLRIGMRAWGFGAALSMVLILGVSLAIALLLKYGDRGVAADV